MTVCVYVACGVVVCEYVVCGLVVYLTTCWRQVKRGVLYTGGYQQGPRYFVDSEGRARPLVVEALEALDTAALRPVALIADPCVHTSDTTYFCFDARVCACWRAVMQSRSRSTSWRPLASRMLVDASKMLR